MTLNSLFCADVPLRNYSHSLTGGKMIHIFEITEPNLPIHFVTFTVLRVILPYGVTAVRVCDNHYGATTKII